MTRYLVFEPPAKAASSEGPVSPSDRAVFLRDALARWAVLFPFLWLFRHGLFLAGAFVLVAWIGLGVIAERQGLGLAAGVLPLLLGALVALEGPSLRAARYRRKGYVEAAVVDADDATEAAILYYAGEVYRPGPAAAPSAHGAAIAEGRPIRGKAMSLLDPAGRR